MITLLLFSVLFTTSNCLSLVKNVPSVTTHAHIVQQVFNHKNVAVKPSHQNTITQTFEAFHNAALKDLIPALENVVHVISAQEQKHGTYTLRDELSLTIMSIQKEHITQYRQTLHDKLSSLEKTLLAIYSTSMKCIASAIRYIKRSYQSPIEKLAYQLEWYTYFEREYLLVDYTAAIHFFAQQRINTYPQCFAFWKEDSNKVKILVLLQKLNTKITPQEEVLAETGMAAAENTADEIIGSTIGKEAEDAALQVTKTEGQAIEKSLLDEAFGDSSFDFSDSIVDTQVAAVSEMAPELENTMIATEDAIENAAVEDSSLLADAQGGESSASVPKGKEYYKQQKSMYKAQLDSIDSELDTIETELTSTSNELKTINQSLESRSAALQRAESRLAELKNAPKAEEADALTGTKGVKPEEIEAAERDVAQLKSECNALKANKDTLQTKMTSSFERQGQLISQRTAINQTLRTLIAEEAAEEAATNASQRSEDAAQEGSGKAGSGKTEVGDTEQGAGAEGEGEDEFVPKKTGKERIQELEQQHAEKMAQLKSIYQDKNKGFFTRAKAYLSFGMKKITTPLRWLDNRMDAYVSSKASNAVNIRFGGTIKSINNNPIRQAIKSLPPSWQGIAELMIQMEAMQASSIVAFWYEQDNEEEYEEWQKKQLSMSQLNTKFTSLMTVQQKQNLNLANQTFINNLKALSSDRQQAQSSCLFSQQWIEQAIFSSPPTSFFTSQSSTIGNNNLPAIDDDYSFKLSSMISPDTTTSNTFIGTVPNAWRNIYRTGNWQYLPANNTFCQLALAPITGNAVTAQANQVLGNSIFREYIPIQSLMYKYSIGCTLYTYQYPFFIGLLFNKGRWISGVPDRQQQMRFAGLFGAPNNKIYFVCEESKISSTQEIKQGVPSTQSPFYRILSNPNAYTLQKNLFSPGTLPCSLTINATSYDVVHPTLANTFTATLTTNNVIPPVSCSITHRNCSSNIGLFHDLGFVSAGCIGSFTIKLPANLTYTQEEVALTNKNITTIINNAQGRS